MGGSILSAKIRDTQGPIPRDTGNQRMRQSKVRDSLNYNERFSQMTKGFDAA